MQHQYQDDSKLLKREDELTDISQMPKSQLDAIAAKPAYTQTDAPASQSTTMQSVSMNEMPKEGQEDNILGSVASIHDQMQPGSFMSPISDRKSGSIENLSTEDKATNTEPGLLKEGIDAVKDAFYVSKEERAEIKDAIVTEAKAFGEAATYFAHVAAEKIEGAYHIAAEKVTEIVHTLEKKAVEIQHDLGLDQESAITRGVNELTHPAHHEESRGASIEQGASELKEDLKKRAYLMRKSMRRYLGKGQRQFEVIEKKAGIGAGFAKVYLTQEAKDLKRRARRFRKDWKKDSKDTKGALKASLKEKARHVDGQARSLGKDAKKEYHLSTQGLKQELSEMSGKAQAFGNEFMKESGKAINIMKQEAQGYFGDFKKQAGQATGALKENASDLTGQARRFEREFKDDFMVSDYLREKARYVRSGARRVLNEIQRSAYLARDELMGQPKSQAFSANMEESKKFLIEIPASEWNGSTQSTGRFSDENKSSSFLIDISASEWNYSSEQAARQRAGYLFNRAQDWMDRAAEEFSSAQKKLQAQYKSGELQKGAKKFYNQASKKAGEVQSMIKGSVDQMIDSASGRLADASDKLNRELPSHQEKGEKGFMDKAAEKGREILGDLDDAADKAKRAMIEKKADLQFQAELLTKDRFPSQEALAKKQAINSEIRNYHQDNKENL